MSAAGEEPGRGDRPKVLMLIDRVGAGAGGGERAASALAGRMPAEGFDVTLCATRKIAEPDRSWLDKAGVELVELGRSRRFALAPFRHLRSLIREQRFDILHAHKFGSNVWGTLFGRALGVPVVIAHEQTWNYDRRTRRMIDRAIGRSVSAFVAVSNADRDRMIELEHIPAEKITVMPNPHAPRPGGDGAGATDIRAELRLPPDADLIGTAAVLRPQKALEVLVTAFNELAESRPRLHLAIAGDGGERAMLEELAARGGHGDRIHFLGMREDIGGFLESLDVVAMSSDYEGAPLFLVECLAHGAPIVSTAVGGIPDMIEHGRTGLLVAPRDPGAMAAAIGELLDDAALRAQFSAAGSARAADFSLERVAARFAELYRELLAEAA